MDVYGDDWQNDNEPNFMHDNNIIGDGDEAGSNENSQNVLNSGPKSKEIEFNKHSVSGLNECLAEDARRLCLTDLAVKLTKGDQYDIGGTYIVETSVLKPELWFYCTTSQLPQSNYILNIFFSTREERSVSIGISDEKRITKKYIDNESLYLTFPETLSWKMFKSCDREEIHHLKSYCFSKKDLSTLQKRILSIPIKININPVSVVDEQILQRIKRTHNLSQLFKRQENTDFMLVSTNGTKYDVHKILLAAHSSVLRLIMRNSNSDSLVLTIDDDGMDQFLEFIYTGTIKTILQHNWYKLIDMANQYKLEHLLKEVEYAITQQISINNAVDIAVLTQKYNMNAIEKKVFAFIKRHPKVLESEGWKNLNDIELTKKLFKVMYGGDNTQ